MEKVVQLLRLSRFIEWKKHSLLVRATLIAMLVMSVSMKVSSQDLSAKKINLTLNAASIKEALQQVQKLSGSRILFGEYVNKYTNAKISIRQKDISVKTALEQILKSTTLEFVQMGSSIMIEEKAAEPANKPSESQQKKIIIRGKVQDAGTKQLIPGVSISVKGTEIKASSDENGMFNVGVPFAEAVMVFSYIGYQPQTVELNGRTSLDVMLVENSKALEEVTVVGYTTQRKEVVTGAVATITTRELVQSPSANINNVLAGRLPGLIASQFSGGEPGVDRSEILIRGKSTYGNQSPIILVDGVERDMSYLAAEEIETFTILKDAASTAPYGIRGANGVIVVTTKRGQASGEAAVSLKMATGFNNPTRVPQMLGSADYATLYNEARINDARRDGASQTGLNLFSPEAIANFRKAKGDNSDGLGYNNDYFNYLFGSGNIQDYNLSVRGGNERARYYVLAGYNGQSTNYNKVDLSDYSTSPKFSRYNFRSNIDVDITKQFWLKLDLGARITDRTAPGTNAARLVNLATTQPPHLPITLQGNDDPANATFISNNPKGMLYGDQFYRFNLLGELSRTGYHNQKITSLNGTFTLGYRLDMITKGLSVDGSFSYDANEEQWLRREVPTYSEGYRVYPGYATFVPVNGSDVFMNPGFYGGAYKTGNKYNIDQSLGNEFSQSNPTNRTYTQFRLNYQRNFQDMHEVAGMVLFNRSNQSAYAGGKAEVDYRYQGLTGQFTYNFKRKYLAEFNFGYNGSENFAKGKRFGFFPAASLGWIISKENFMQGAESWLDQLKVRGSFGLVGSDKLSGGSRFGYLQAFVNGSGYQFGSNFANGLSGMIEGTLANVNLTWEKARKTNIGLDATFLKQRLTFTADVFREYRYDILTALNDDNRMGFPAVAGTSAPFVNSGIVRNHGLEFEFGWNDRIGKDFRYSIRPNFSFARNKIVFQNEVPRAYSWRQQTGRRLDENFVYVFDHFVADQAEADRLNAAAYQQWGTLIPGDVVYKDLNGDGKVEDQGDRMAMGSPRSPEIQFGLPVVLQYKGLDVSVLFQGATNTSVLLRDAAVWDFPQFDQDKTGTVKPMHLKRWTPETAATAKYPALHLGQHSNNKNTNSSLFLYDASYVRIKNIELGFTFPKKMVRKIGLNNIRFYAQGQNLFTWDGMKDADVDPEIGNTSGSWYPVLKVYNFGLDITL